MIIERYERLHEHCKGTHSRLSFKKFDNKKDERKTEENAKGDRKSLKDIRCFRCGEKDYYSRKCDKPKQPTTKWEQFKITHQYFIRNFKDERKTENKTRNTKICIHRSN